jgi:hypothetical protein
MDVSLWNMGAASCVLSTCANAVTRDDLERFEALVRADERERAAKLREWAKLAFRVINNVVPALRLYEPEDSSEAEMVDHLAEMGEAVAMQYPSILGVNYIDAIKDARAAIRSGGGV